MGRTDGKAAASEPVGDVGFGEDESLPGDFHHAFIRAATGRGRQRLSRLGNVSADDGEVATLKLPNIRATAAAETLGSVGVRVGSEASKEESVHALLVPIGTYPVNLFLLYLWGVANPRPELIGSSVARLLREKRVALGLSMNAVAIKAGLSHTMVSRVERELRKPTLDTLLRITGAMGIDLWPILKKAESAGASPKTTQETR